MNKLSMGLEYGVNFAKRLFGKNVAQAAPKAEHMTRTMTNYNGEVLGLTRGITLKNGEEGYASIRYLGNNSRSMTIYNQNGNIIDYEIKSIYRKKGASSYGGDSITIFRDHPKNDKRIILQKDYGQNGTLERKELTVTDIPCFTEQYTERPIYTLHHAIQEKASLGRPLTNSYKDML